MHIEKCPQCNQEIEKGFVNAPLAGILWFTNPNIKWKPWFSRKVSKLQKDWWGFPKLAKDNLPAFRCQRCKLVIFEYSNEQC